MARFNEILAGRYNRYLQKLFQLKGGPPAAQLASEVMPVFPFFSGVEHRYLESWYRYYGQLSVAAIAAVGPSYQIRNPLNSGVVAVIERLTLESDAQTFWQFSQQGAGATADLVNLFVGFRMDPRGQGAPVVIMSTSATIVADLPANIFVESTQTQVMRDVIISGEDQELLLMPGEAMRFRQTVVNVTTRVNLLWRERSLEDSEFK